MSIGMILVLIYIAILAVYLIYGATLSIIADKAGVKNSWRAWVPFFNIFLEFDIAQISYFYFLLWIGLGILGALLHLTAEVDLLALIFSMYIWARICERLGKNRWLGILGGIPIVSFLFKIYLALAQTTTSTSGKIMTAKGIAALPIDLGIYNFIKNEIAAGKSKEQIFTELASSNIANDKLETAYVQALREK